MNKIYETSLVIAGGAIGGLISVVDAWQDPLAFPLTVSKFAALLAIPVLKGGVAAGIGVYLLTTVDATQIIRTFFFAVTCGLTFPSILANGASSAQRATSQVATAQVTKNVNTLTTVANAQSRTSASPPELPTGSIAAIRDASLEIIQAAPKAAESEAKAGDTAIQQAVSTLANAPNSASDPAMVDAISQIGSAAAGRNLPLTSDVVVRELKTLQDAASATAPVRERASAAIRQLERIGPVSR